MTGDDEIDGELMKRNSALKSDDDLAQMTTFFLLEGLTDPSAPKRGFQFYIKGLVVKTQNEDSIQDQLKNWMSGKELHNWGFCVNSDKTIEVQLHFKKARWISTVAKWATGPICEKIHKIKVNGSYRSNELARDVWEKMMKKPGVRYEDEHLRSCGRKSPKKKKAKK